MSNRWTYVKENLQKRYVDLKRDVLERWIYATETWVECRDVLIHDMTHSHLTWLILIWHDSYMVQAHVGMSSPGSLLGGPDIHTVRDTSHINDSRINVRTSRVTCGCVMTRINESCHTWALLAPSLEALMSTRYVTCHMWMSHVTCEWFISHANESCIHLSVYVSLCVCIYLYVFVSISKCLYLSLCVCIYLYVFVSISLSMYLCTYHYGVALVSRIKKIMGLFCKRAL